MTNPTTKSGKHGTMYLYELTYTDTSDSGMGEIKARLWAYNLEHAEDKFYDAPDSGGWTLLRGARVPADSMSMHRATQHSF